MMLRDFNKTALTYGSRAIPYRELLDQAVRYAAACPARAGVRVALFAENRPEWVFAFYSAWSKGAIAVPIDGMAPADELAAILADAAPTTLFTSRDKEPVAREALARTGLPARLILFESLPETPPDPAPAALPEPDPAAVAAILYTSGTTGSPKGVMLTYANLAANVDAVSRGVPIFTPGDRLFAFLPFHHILPLMGNLVVPLSIGATVAIADSLKPDALAACMQANRVTLIIGVPRFWALLRKGIRDRIRAAGPLPRLLFRIAARLRSRRFSRRIFHKVHDRFGGQIRFLVSGGAPLDAEVLRDFQTLGFELLEGYGMTETAPIIAFPRPGQVRNGSCGQVLPGEEVRIVEGEITVRGPNVMTGYYRKPVETAEALRDGWLFTGDLGYLDDDGYLFITGRKKELIVLPSGKKINPFEIESRLLEIAPALKEAAVFQQGASLQAILVPDRDRFSEPGPAALEARIQRDCLDPYNQNASPYKRIARFTIRDEELPKTRIGKLRRHLLPALAESPPDARPAPPEPAGAVYPRLRDFLSAEREHPVRPDSHLERDLGLDSLGRLELLAFLENSFGLELAESCLTDHPTVAALAAFVEARKTRIEDDPASWSTLLHAVAARPLPQPAWTMRAIQLLARTGFHAWFDLEISGARHLPEGPFILAPNHQSYLDGLFVILALPPETLRRTWFYAKEKHVRTPFLRWMAAHNNVIVVSLERDLRQSLQRLAAVLKSGGNMIIFPEGTRTPDGLLGPFKRTFAILGQELRVPIVPVSILGAFEALPRGGRLPRPFTRIRVQFLPPVHPDGLSSDAIRDRVRDAILQVVE